MSPDRWAAVLSRSATWRTTVSAAARLAAWLVAAIAFTAAIVAATGPRPARRFLQFPFTGVSATPSEALAIFDHNLLMLAGVLGLLLIAQAPLQAGLRPGSATRVMRAAGELLIGGAIGANVFVIGMALGAYGLRMGRALVPHGPVELAAYALVLALYQQGHQTRLDLGHATGVIAASVALLAAAAGLETSVTP